MSFTVRYVQKSFFEAKYHTRSISSALVSRPIAGVRVWPNDYALTILTAKWWRGQKLALNEWNNPLKIYEDRKTRNNFPSQGLNVNGLENWCRDDHVTPWRLTWRTSGHNAPHSFVRCFFFLRSYFLTLSKCRNAQLYLSNDSNFAVRWQELLLARKIMLSWTSWKHEHHGSFVSWRWAQ